MADDRQERINARVARGPRAYDVDAEAPDGLPAPHGLCPKCGEALDRGKADERFCTSCSWDESCLKPCGNRGGEQLCAADDPLLCSTHWNMPDYHPTPRPAFTAAEKKAMMDMLAQSMEKAPPMYENDEAYWQKYLGGPLPPASIMPHRWNGILQSVAQSFDVVDVKVGDLIELVWKDNANVRYNLEEKLRRGSFHNDAAQFFKIGFRSTKDAGVVARNPRDLTNCLKNSERAFEEIAMAKARGWETMPILLRRAIDSPALDRTELRVYVVDKRIMALSTGPYTFHSERMAKQLAEQAWPTLKLIAVGLPVRSAWVDVFYHDGAWFLCDVNPDNPTTWPGHFATLPERPGGLEYWLREEKVGTYLAYEKPNPHGVYGKHTGVVQLPTGVWNQP